MPASPTARAFLSTPSARRATGASHGRSTIACYFYPRPPRGGRLRAFFVLIRHEFQFLSTPSARRATAAHRMDSTAQRRFLSTPSARRATHFKSISGYTQQQFLSTPSARRATVAVAGAAALAIDFYPRPPRGGRPGIVGLHCVAKNISIHALREEGDFSVHLPVRCHPISIHALREEGDVAGVVSLWVVHRFLSTPSARRATCCPRCCLHPFGISIHALREKGDGKHRSGVVLGGFISIHALREEGDSFPFAFSQCPGTFLSTPSARRATGSCS